MKCVYCSKSRDGSVRRFLHRFPTKRPQELQSWLKNINLYDNKQPLEHLRLCSEHFCEECFITKNGIVTLRQGSIPTLFRGPKHQSKCIYCNVSKAHEDNCTFHKFPLKNSALLQKWLSGIPLQNFFPTKDDILCFDHFEPNCFRWAKDKLRLKTLVVPTIFKPALFTEINIFNSTIELEITDSETVTNVTETGMEIPDSETVTNVIETGMEIADSETVTKTRVGHYPTLTKTDAEIETTIDLRHDHHYENSPRTLRIQLASARKMITKYKNAYKSNRKQIKRLTTKISSLKDLVRTLRKKTSVNESGLECLELIADSDVSEFLRRYARNANKQKQIYNLFNTSII